MNYIDTALLFPVHWHQCFFPITNSFCTQKTVSMLVLWKSHQAREIPVIKVKSTIERRRTAVESPAVPVSSIKSYLFPLTATCTVALENLKSKSYKVDWLDQEAVKHFWMGNVQLMKWVPLVLWKVTTCIWYLPLGWKYALWCNSMTVYLSVPFQNKMSHAITSALQTITGLGFTGFPVFRDTQKWWRKPKSWSRVSDWKPRDCQIHGQHLTWIFWQETQNLLEKSKSWGGFSERKPKF